MGEVLQGTGGLVNRFAGGVDRGRCYQINGASRRVVNGEIETTGSETQLTASQARIVAEAVLEDLAHHGEYGLEAVNRLATILRTRARRAPVRP